jgi:hypothetical protein
MEGLLMPRLITVSKAKDEIKRLKEYIDLAESYETDSLEKQIIKEYAFTTSIAKIVSAFGSAGIKNGDQPVDRQYIISVINGKVNDQLHRIVKSGYLSKTKHTRNRKL